jgi:DNA-binding transcriptional ArsR family regulator
VRLGEPVGGLTLRALEQHLSKQALDPRLVERVIGQLGALERARFDPGSQGTVELTHALEGVRDVVRELVKVRAKRSA